MKCWCGSLNLRARLGSGEGWAPSTPGIRPRAAAPAARLRKVRRAVSFVKDFRAKFRDIARDPLLYRLRPEIGDEARLAAVGNYAILFRVLGESVRIERVTYAGRDLTGALDPSSS